MQNQDKNYPNTLPKQPLGQCRGRGNVICFYDTLNVLILDFFLVFLDLCHGLIS